MTKKRPARGKPGLKIVPERKAAAQRITLAGRLIAEMRSQLFASLEQRAFVSVIGELSALNGSDPNGQNE